jgi:hypothetical protein
MISRNSPLLSGAGLGSSAERGYFPRVNSLRGISGSMETTSYQEVLVNGLSVKRADPTHCWAPSASGPVTGISDKDIPGQGLGIRPEFG